MKNKLLMITSFLIFLAACSKNNRIIEQPDVKGRWFLSYTTTEKNNIILRHNNDNVTFKFDNNTLDIDRDCYTYKKGAYNYIVKTESYFQPEDKESSKSRVLQIGETRYLLEMTYDGKKMFLTNYSDSIITMKLEKEQ